MKTCVCTSSKKITIFYYFLLFSKSKFSAIFAILRLLFTDTTDSYNGKGRDRAVFISLGTFRHLFVTLHLKLLTRIFNRIASNY